MKKLSAWAGIILVPTLIAGVYGMNFEFMPELHWRFGYLFVWAVMAVVTGALWWVFRKKQWI
jgi:magnesium transporter